MLPDVASGATYGVCAYDINAIHSAFQEKSSVEFTKSKSLFTEVSKHYRVEFSNDN